MKKMNFCAHQKSGYTYSPLVSIYSVHYSKLLGKCHWEEVNIKKKKKTYSSTLIQVLRGCDWFRLKVTQQPFIRNILSVKLQFHLQLQLSKVYFGHSNNLTMDYIKLKVVLSNFSFFWFVSCTTEMLNLFFVILNGDEIGLELSI